MMDYQLDYLHVPDRQEEIYPWVGGCQDFNEKEDAINYALELGKSYGGFESTLRVKLEKKDYFIARLNYCFLLVKKLESGKWIVHDW